MREPDKTFDDLLTMGRALEMADAQSLTMERDSVNKVHTTQCPQPHKPRGCNENIRQHNHNDKGKQHTRSCCNCGGQFPHTIKCPAKGKTCNFCKKHNHCSKGCRSRLKREDFQEVKTKEAIIESSSDEEYAYTIKKKTEHVSVVSTKTPKVNVTVNEKQCKFLLDTGATSQST